jgi:hypothetical protein
MSSKETTVSLDSKQEIQFTQSELQEIVSISESYSQLYRKAMIVRKQIDESTRQLNDLAGEMEHIKTNETHFFQTIAGNLNIEPKTVATAAANYILSKTQ